jgi:hypothetical protein
MYCKKCGRNIDDDSAFCRHCGAPQRPTPAVEQDATTKTEPAQDLTATPGLTPEKLIGFAIGGLILLVALVTVFGPSSAPDNSSNLAMADNSVDDAIAAADNALEAAASALEEAAATTEAPGGSKWSYTTDEDKVRGATTYYARTTSTNSVFQEAPYDSSTTMDMIVRKSPAYGTDVLLVISSGQMMCPSYDGCSGTVRFDDGPAQRVSFNGPADNSSDTVFIVGAKSFISKLKKSKKVVVEKTLYQAGSPQFEFAVDGLKWDH